MAEVEAPIEMTDAELIAHCDRLTAELNRRKLANLNGQPDQEKCRALYDVSNAAQEALIANNCLVL